jgi:hypothetical protein
MINRFDVINHVVKYPLHPVYEMYCTCLTQPTLFQSSVGNREVSRQITRSILNKYSYFCYKYVRHFTVRITRLYFSTHNFERFKKNMSFLRNISLVDCASTMPCRSSPAQQYDSVSLGVQHSTMQRTDIMEQNVNCL